MIKNREVKLSAFILYTLGFYLFSWIIRPVLIVYTGKQYPFSHYIVELIFCIGFSISIVVFYGTFEYEKQQRCMEVSKMHMIICISVASVYVLIRLFMRIIYGKQAGYPLFLWFTTLVSVLAEEVLTKCILLRYLKTKRINSFLRIILISLIFTFIHIDILTSPYPLARIMGLMVFQLATICVYEAYPSVVVSTVYHYILDMVVMI